MDLQRTVKKKLNHTQKMNEENEAIASEKRRIAKPAVFVLISVMFKRYSTAAILCRFILTKIFREIFADCILISIPQQF